jgi:hypothetical protein
MTMRLEGALTDQFVRAAIDFCVRGVVARKGRLRDRYRRRGRQAQRREHKIHGYFFQIIPGALQCCARLWRDIKVDSNGCQRQ